MQTRASQSALPRIILFQIATLGLLLIINIIGLLLMRRAACCVMGISIRRTPHLRAMCFNLHGALFPQIIPNNSIYMRRSVHQQYLYTTHTCKCKQ
jgi:hypothetical protein